MPDEQAFFRYLVSKRGLKSTSLAVTKIRWRVIERFVKDRTLTPQLAEEFILQLVQKGLRNATINSYVRIFFLIDHFYNSHDIDSKLTKNISYFTKDKKVPTILSYEEIMAIISVNIDYSGRRGVTKLQAEKLNGIYKHAIWFLAATGCRFDEMASIRVENIFLGNSSYVVFKDTKTAIDRRVPIPPDLARSLGFYLSGKKPSDLAFPSTTGKKQAPQTFNPNLRQRVKLANIKKHVHAHVFRYSYIMEHVCRGTDVLAIGKLVGHEDPKTTLGYTKYNFDLILKSAENHPMFTNSLDNHKLFNRIVEEIKKIQLLCGGQIYSTLNIQGGAINFNVVNPYHDSHTDTITTSAHNKPSSA